MSDLFMQMHQRRLSEAGGAATRTASRSPSAYTSPERRSNEADDSLANILRVQLKKPAQWRWELSTSRSASNIALPRIMLYDHKGTLLVDADTQEEKVYSQAAAPSPPASSTTTSGTKRHVERQKRAATTNLTHSIRQALEREFTDLQIHDTAYLRSCSGSPLSAYSAYSGSAIDFNSNELPNEHRSTKSRSHSHSLKVRFKDDAADDVGHAIASLPTPPSTSTTTTINTTPATSSSSGPREKRRYRRSRSSGGTPTGGSPSILERFSFSKGRLSSPEYAEEHEVRHAPRYILRSSKAGTLVVQEESFSRSANCRRRRRPRNSSAENIASGGSVSKCQSMSSLKGVPAPRRALLTTIESVESRERSSSLQNVTQDGQRGRRKLQPIRRFRSDGNVLLHRQLSTSDEEAATAAVTRRPYNRSKQHLQNGDIIGAPQTNGYGDDYVYNQRDHDLRQRFQGRLY